MEVQTANAETNTNTFNQIGIVSNDKSKKKPYNITFKNFNPNEPKIRKSSILYTDKQKFRNYKTKTEPKLYNKIMVDDEEDLIAKIRKEFGIEDKTRKNYSEVETTGMPYYQEPIPTKRAPPEIIPILNDDFTDMTNSYIEDLLGEIITSVENRFEIKDVADDLEEGEVEEGEIQEEVNEALLTSLTIDGLTKMSQDELDEISKKLYKIALKNNFTYSGKKPKKPEAIFKRAQDILNEITNMNKTAETSEVVEKK